MTAKQLTGIAGKRRLAAFFGLALALASTGCGRLGFEKETVVAAFPADRDEVRVVLVYEGLTVLGDKDSDLQDAKSQLKELATEQTFYLGSNALCLSLKPEPARFLNDEEKQNWKLIEKHVTLRNGAFFLNEDGRLSFYQHLAIRDAQEFVRGCNERISAAVAKFAAKGLALDRATRNAGERAGWDKWDVETLKRWQAASTAKHAWLRLEPGRISLVLPGTEQYFARLKREFLTEYATNPWVVRLLSGAAWSLDQRRHQLTVALGSGDGQAIRVVFNNDVSGRKYERELLSHARTLAVPFSKTATSKSLIDKLAQEK
jgi:hypothetical protein